MTGQRSRWWSSRRLLELRVDRPRAPRSASAAPPSLFTRAVRMSARRSASIVRPTIFAGSISKSSSGGSIPARPARSPPCGRGSRGRSRAASSTSARRRRARRPPRRARCPTPSSYFTANSIASIRLKYVASSGAPRARLHPRRDARDARDRVDRVAEQVAVVDARAAAELAHRVAQAGLDERVDHHRRAARAPAAPRCSRSSTFSTRGCRISSNGWSGNCASSASTSRCAVSPVESETMWSSTGGRSASCALIRGEASARRRRRVTSRAMPDARHDGQDRLARDAPRVRLPVVGDLRRARLLVRLRALRRAAQGERQGALARGDGARARRHRRARLVDHPPPARSGRPRATSTGFADPLVDCRFCKRRYRADQLDQAQCGQRPSKHPGETEKCDLTEPRQFNLMFKTRIGAGRGDGPGRLPAPGDGAGHLRQLQERRPDRAPQAAVRHRADREGVPQRDHARQLHLPHARVRADGDGVLRPARRGAGVVPRTGSSERVAWHLPLRPPREPPARAPARRRGALALLVGDERHRVPLPDRLVGARGHRAPRRLRPHRAHARRPGRSSSGSTARSATRRTSSSPRSA